VGFRGLCSARLKHLQVRMECNSGRNSISVRDELDVSFEFEPYTIRGMAKMKARVGIAMIVMLAMALDHIKEKRREMMRSLVKFD
jgi:hypothetical protein